MTAIAIASKHDKDFYHQRQYQQIVDMALKAALVRDMRFALRWYLIILLISSPVTFFPIIAGIEGAITFHIWSHDQIEHQMKYLEVEAERRMSMNYYNVPGALTMHQFLAQKGPFHVPKLGSLDWTDELGLTLPNEYLDPDVGINKRASLEGLVRSAGYRDSGKPNQYWVYVTVMSDWMQSEWDAAFEEILQESYVRPLPQNPGLAYLDCASTSFLSGVWGVQAPSLLHFSISEESLADQEEEEAMQGESDETSESDEIIESPYEHFTYDSPRSRLFPVTVRVIELPLTDAESLLPRDTLATPALQLRAILHDPDPASLAQNWDIHRDEIQILRRFNDYSDALTERRGTWRYHFTNCDVWYSRTILKPIFGKEFIGNGGFLAEVQNFVFTINVLLLELGRLPFTVCWEIYTWFFGLGWDGEPASTAVFGEQEDVGGDNWMEDMMAGFWQHAMQKVEQHQSESAAKAAVTDP